MGAQPLVTRTSASAVRSDIHSLVHASHARERIRSSEIAFCPLFNLWELMDLSMPLAGLHIRPTAHLHYLLHSESRG